MVAIAKRVFSFTLLIALTFLFYTQVLNVRSPMIIQIAQAAEATPYVAGTVTVSGGNPNNVQITLAKSGGPILTKYTNGAGSFTFSGLTPGYYTIKSYRADVTPAQTNFTLNPGYAARAEIRLVTRYGSPPTYIHIIPFFLY